MGQTVAEYEFRHQGMEAVTLSYIRGDLVLVGPHIEAVAHAWMPQTPVSAQSKDSFLVTVVTDDELRQSQKEFDKSGRVVGIDSVIGLGVGCQDSVYFTAILWKEGIKLRRELGLPFRQLHIVLSGQADHFSDPINLRSWVMNFDLSEISNSSVRDPQISLVVDYCKLLAQDPSLMTPTATTGPEIVAFLRHVSSIPRIRSEDATLLDFLAVMLYKMKDVNGCMAAAGKLISDFPKDPRGYFRCAACHFHIGKNLLRVPSQDGTAAADYCRWKVAMVLYAETVKLALEAADDEHHPARALSERLIQQACQAILQCAKYTEFGCLMTCAESEVFPKEYLGLTLPWNPGVRNAVLQAFIAKGEPGEVLSLESRERLCIFDSESKQFLRLPRFFRWITPFRVAAMSTPKNVEDVRLLARLGIGVVVTLTKEEELSSTWFTAKISNEFLPVVNYRAPTIAQIDYFFSLVDVSFETESAILVQCGGGKGRAGTFVACYLARYGFVGVADQTDPKYSATEIIKAVRCMRPGSIETEEQERFIGGFVKELWRRAQTGGKLLLLPEPKPENGSDDLEIEGTFNPKCKMLVCCGIPGSGKSTVSKCLAGAGWTVASQDETGSWSAAAAVASKAMRHNNAVIVDRCNPTIRDRREWIDLAMLSPNEVSCLFFDYDENLCLQRAKLRLDHPTLTSDSQCTNAIRSMSKSLQRPSMSEGFGAIVTIRSIAAANKFVQFCGAPMSKDSDASSSSSSSSLPAASDPQKRLPKFHKFPRTRHLFNFGSATRDDLIMTKGEVEAFFGGFTFENREAGNVVTTLEEKVDGANLGFSIDPETGDIRAQNRSHFVNSKSHSQFRKLDFWIDSHREELTNLLCAPHSMDGNSDRGRYILFGEWLLATHSIRYTRLPDYFLAFDVYDTAEQKFWSRELFWTALRRTSISVVPSIPLSSDMTHEEVFKGLMERQSAFYDGSIEGVYVRRDDGPFLLDRGKVVRADFISGNAHWSKQVTANIVERF